MICVWCGVFCRQVTTVKMLQIQGVTAHKCRRFTWVLSALLAVLWEGENKKDEREKERKREERGHFFCDKLSPPTSNINILNLR